MKDELDDMKNLWQNAPTPSLDAAQVEAMLATRSQNALARLRTNLLIEAGLGVLLVLALPVLIDKYISTSQAQLALVQVLFLTGPVFIFYYFALRQLQKSASPERPLRQMLQEAVEFWQTALRLYFWAGVLLLPPLLIAIRWLVVQIRPHYPLQPFSGSSSVILLKALTLWLLLSVLLWWLIRFSYGKYADKLKACLHEMEEAG